MRHEIEIEKPMLLTGEVLEAMQRAVSAYSTLAGISVCIRKSVDEDRWLIHKGGHHIAVIRKAFGAAKVERVAIVKEIA